MPNRIIKESAFTSDKVARLTDFEFRLWVGLITQADDAGRGDARPAIVRGRVFALRESVSAAEIERGLRALAAAGCIALYRVGGQPYFYFPHWASHQRIRDVKPKFPSPEEAGENPAAKRGELPQPAAERGSDPIQGKSQSLSERERPARAQKEALFVPPTVEEAESYCRERQNGIDARRFVDYYESRGWMLRDTPMRDWRAALRAWERREGAPAAAKAPPTPEELQENREHLEGVLKRIKGEV